MSPPTKARPGSRDGSGFPAAYRCSVTLPADELVATYLRALSAADAPLAISLFADGGLIHSPLYGPLPATEFYPALFADTSRADLTLKSVMQGIDQEGAHTLSFWFHF